MSGTSEPDRTVSRSGVGFLRGFRPKHPRQQGKEQALVTDAPTRSADEPGDDLSRSRFVLALALALLAAALLRGCLPLADPPWHATSGIVWHDEGAWLHNARNMALFGEWRLDQWNPLYLAPVFSWVEYASFRLFGVGLWQARLVSEVFGVLAVLCAALAVRQASNRWAGLAAGVLLATNYVWVMWNRAALLETMMVSFMVFSAFAYVQAHRRGGWVWGLAAGAFAVLAFFTKAAAAFFLIALGVEAAWSAWHGRRGPGHAMRAGAWTLAGLSLAGAAALVLFVLPNWTEVRFYNWQMSVTRKPEYSLRAIADRASWFPVIHDFFTRMWVVLLLAVGGVAGVVCRWRSASPFERLVLAWITLGVAELLVHDVGNERRFVFLIPPLVMMAALTLGRDRQLLPLGPVRFSRAQAVALLPVVLAASYLLAGSVVRLAFLYEVRPAVRLGALAAVLSTAALYAAWPRMRAWTSGARWSRPAAAVLLGVLAIGDLAQYGQWVLHRTYVNYQAMTDLATWLPAGTLVQGKLANGLSLESRIRPVFVGNGFGNYDDRLQRTDIRYALTYTRPRLAYEGRVLLDVLEHRRWRIVHRFPVAETASGRDEAALIEFLPSSSGGTR